MALLFTKELSYLAGFAPGSKPHVPSPAPIRTQINTVMKFTQSTEMQKETGTDQPVPRFPSSPQQRRNTRNQTFAPLSLEILCAPPGPLITTHTCLQGSALLLGQPTDTTRAAGFPPPPWPLASSCHCLWWQWENFTK